MGILGKQTSHEEGNDFQEDNTTMFHWGILSGKIGSGAYRLDPHPPWGPSAFNCGRLGRWHCGRSQKLLERVCHRLALTVGICKQGNIPEMHDRWSQWHKVASLKVPWGWISSQRLKVPVTLWGVWPCSSMVSCKCPIFVLFYWACNFCAISVQLGLVQ